MLNLLSFFKKQESKALDAANEYLKKKKQRSKFKLDAPNKGIINSSLLLKAYKERKTRGT